MSNLEIRLGSPDTERQIAKLTGISASPWQEARALFPTKEFKDLKILDVGAGLSDIVASLLERGANAFAIDPLYRDLAGLRGISEEYLVDHSRRYTGYEAMIEARELSVRRF